MSISIANPYRHSLPRVPFSRMQKLILGDSYSVSIAFIKESEMRRMNRTYRHKDESTDILSFPLSKTSGELYISMRDVRRKAAQRGISPKAYAPYLVLHGMVHLKGLDHGRKMTALEKKFARVLSIQIPD